MTAAIIVSVADYRDITCDRTTPDETVSARIDEAIELLEEELDRWLPLDTYTEELRVVNGHVYPQGVPVQSMLIPSADAEIEMAGFAVRLSGFEFTDPYFATLLQPPVIDPVTGDTLATTHLFPTIEYVGGFTHDTFPTTLRRVITDLAWHLIRATPATLSTADATSMSVGDVSVSYKSSSGSGQLDTYMPGLSRRVSRWRRQLGSVSA